MRGRNKRRVMYCRYCNVLNEYRQHCRQHPALETTGGSRRPRRFRRSHKPLRGGKRRKTRYQVVQVTYRQEQTSVSGLGNTSIALPCALIMICFDADPTIIQVTTINQGEGEDEDRCTIPGGGSALCFAFFGSGRLLSRESMGEW
ncbi:hypothetical protein BU24DRAFT_28919 [Aaosphaeria arxii CBS 175.79]|uniref:Uncharacterized protein n=1 Tax=Aaosphaeria arxii CBS 175.79 TaxID=1450172 RepID=A0A6A5Y982_9PLEO|nr:uncharacterized protein BU24DRAFT_28919 [Aaosphaeria arxii CBS 175.79]KAF2021793.1 hypothetical protein BU24DRAFT_28919 [Aaosphaeria arxii CBS 175.79]